VATSAGVGLCTDPESLSAARTAARAALERAGVPVADWALVFMTSPHRPQFAGMLAEIQKTLGTQMITGCSASGVLTGSEEVEGRPAVAVLAVRSDTMRASTFFVSLGENDPKNAAREMARQIGADPPGLTILLPDPFAARPDHLLHEVGRSNPEREAVGAAASADAELRGTFQLYGRNVAGKAVTGLHLSGDLRRAIGITHGCQPLGPQARITSGDGNVILEVDGRPALDVLRSCLPGSLADSLGMLGGHLFVGLPPDPLQEEIVPGEYLVRNLVAVDAGRGALIVGATVRPNEPLYFVLREGHAAREDLKEMLRRVDREAGGSRRFGLYFNCAARGSSLYGMPGIDTAYISSAFGDLPIIGFFGNAEIAPLRGRNHLFTHTGVLSLIGDRDTESAPADGV
jgi:small ligand-binding sensory domain FIST